MVFLSEALEAGADLSYLVKVYALGGGSCGLVGVLSYCLLPSAWSLAAFDYLIPKFRL